MKLKECPDRAPFISLRAASSARPSRVEVVRNRRTGVRAMPKVVPLFSIVLSTLLLASPSRAGKTFDFEFHDEENLYPGQHNGGRAYVPKQVNAEEPVPLVVFLHGLNRFNQLHMWLGPGPDDLRARLDDWIKRGDLPPAVIAAPSQTREALWPSTLWTGIDLDEFVTAAERAIGDRARICAHLA
jgi:hypothetical protein